MRAVVLEQIGPPENLTLQERPVPEPAAGEVLVRVHACGVCGRDLVDRKGGFPYMRLPIVPGHEMAGVVERLGAGVSDLVPGQRVVNLHRAACRRCAACRRGEELHCTGWWQAFGLTVDGGYADFVVAQEGCLVPLPDEIPFEAAASLNCTAAVALRGLRTRARLEAGERLLVTGASGGVGLAAVRIGKLMGAYVVGVTSSAERARRVVEAGADDVIVNGDASFHKVLPALVADGADVVLEAVGKPTFNASLRALRAGGRLVLVGNVTAEQVAVNPGRVILQGLSILGSSVSSRRDLEDVLSWVARGKLVADVDRVLPLSAAAEAHQLLENRAAVGRVVLAPQA
jgi:D-arabinose 1-dehydrogenase-like Zn-dependent alcohol dehydrogenase